MLPLSFLCSIYFFFFQRRFSLLASHSNPGGIFWQVITAHSSSLWHCLVFIVNAQYTNASFPNLCLQNCILDFHQDVTQAHVDIGEGTNPEGKSGLMCAWKWQERSNQDTGNISTSRCLVLSLPFCLCLYLSPTHASLAETHSPRSHLIQSCEEQKERGGSRREAETGGEKKRTAQFWRVE